MLSLFLAYVAKKLLSCIRGIKIFLATTMGLKKLPLHRLPLRNLHHSLLSCHLRFSMNWLQFKEPFIVSLDQEKDGFYKLCCDIERSCYTMVIQKDSSKWALDIHPCLVHAMSITSCLHFFTVLFVIFAKSRLQS